MHGLLAPFRAAVRSLMLHRHLSYSTAPQQGVHLCAEQTVHNFHAPYQDALPAR